MTVPQQCRTICATSTAELDTDDLFALVVDIGVADNDSDRDEPVDRDVEKDRAVDEVVFVFAAREVAAEPPAGFGFFPTRDRVLATARSRAPRIPVPAPVSLSATAETAVVVPPAPCLSPVTAQALLPPTPPDITTGASSTGLRPISSIELMDANILALPRCKTIAEAEPRPAIPPL